nr:hypothetical protein [Candidatus Njordarchaeota archaeon]
MWDRARARQGVIISTQRPNISQNIIANAATKIFLRTTVDSEKAARWLNLNDEQTNYLKAMPKMEAIIVTPKHSKPIRIKTIQVDLLRVDNHDIILNDMINYPIIYDVETKSLDMELATHKTNNENTMITRATHPEVKRLKTIAEEAYQDGNYKEALRTYIRAIEAMKNQKSAKEIPRNGPVQPEDTARARLQPTLTQTQRKSSPQPFLPPNQTPKTPNQNSNLASEQQTERPVQGKQPTASNLNHQPPPTLDEKPTWIQVKQVFKHPQEIIDETTLKTRLNTETRQQLQKQIGPLISRNLIGEVTAPSYKDIDPATTIIYYQISDHQNRDILKEYITTTICKDLHSKGINTTWIDQNMELLATTNNNPDQNQYVITTWTHNTISPATTLTRLKRIKQQLQEEQIKELIIVLPWRNEARKLQKLITHLRLSGITPIPFSENETNKLINHITYGTPMNP